MLKIVFGIVVFFILVAVIFNAAADFPQYELEEPSFIGFESGDDDQRKELAIQENSAHENQVRPIEQDKDIHSDLELESSYDEVSKELGKNISGNETLDYAEVNIFENDKQKPGEDLVINPQAIYSFSDAQLVKLIDKIAITDPIKTFASAQSLKGDFWLDRLDGKFSGDVVGDVDSFQLEITFADGHVGSNNEFNGDLSLYLYNYKSVPSYGVSRVNVNRSVRIAQEDDLTFLLIYTDQGSKWTPIPNLLFQIVFPSDKADQLHGVFYSRASSKEQYRKSGKFILHRS